MLYDAVVDALNAQSADIALPVDTLFSWYFRDEDRWLTVESRAGRVAIRQGLTETAEMRFYSSCVADFIHQHTTEGAGRAIFQGGGFYWRGDMSRLKEIAPLCKTLFGPRLHQRLVGAGIHVPKFEARRYPARTKAQRDRILAEWMSHGERLRTTPATRVSMFPTAEANINIPSSSMVARATKSAKTVKAAKTVKVAQVTKSLGTKNTTLTPKMSASVRNTRVAKKA